MYRVDFQILYLCPKSKEKACISAGILKLMARFELATSSLPNGSGILILGPKIEQKRSKIDKKRQFRAEFLGDLKDAKYMQDSVKFTSS